MIQIIVLTKGISIGGINYPDNSISFEIVNKDYIRISNTYGNVLFNTIYTDFMNASSITYASAQAVIDELTLSYS